MKTKLISIILLFISFWGNSQVWHIKRNINYDNMAGGSGLTIAGFISFPGEVFPHTLNELPHFTDLVEWKSPAQVSNVEIISPVFEAFEGIVTDTAFFNLSSICSLEYSTEYMRKTPYIQYNILPFRKNPETGKIERLKSFILRMEAEQNSSESAVQKKLFPVKNSVLATGSWYKIRVASSGIYKLTFEQINSMGIGNPANVRVFGSGGGVLPEDYRKGEKDDLIPTQIYMYKGSDGVFNSGDYILFYSQGSVKWSYQSSSNRFQHELNPYSNFSYYFVTSGESPDFPALSQVQEPSDYSTDTYDYRTFHEEELENVLLSGKQWFGESFGGNTQQTFSFSIPGLVTSQPVKLELQVMAKSISPSEFLLSYGNTTILTLPVAASGISDYTSIYGYFTKKITQIDVPSGSFSLKLKFNKPEASAKGFLDFLNVSARANLQLISDFLEFRDMKTLAAGRITNFNISSAGNRTVVWDVTNTNNILKMDGSLNGSVYQFSAATDEAREFVAFNENGSFPSPEITGKDLGKIQNQNLHGSFQPQMVIIVYPDFKEQAERLANFRREHNGLDVLVVTPEMLYNEFSSGTPDISAFRNYMKMLYKRAETNAELPDCLLLFGDGTFDNKGITENANNYILTYQSENSLNPVASYVSDDFFGLLDPGEDMNSGLLDIGVGRLTVSSKEEAAEMTDKILGYEMPDKMGDWRNSLCFIGDDEDGNVHMYDADALATFTQTRYPVYNINKIYLDAYKQTTVPGGHKYPDVNKAINDQVERGALIVNYTGHGGILGWAHEEVLILNDINRWKNTNRLPLFMTATCEFSRYDDHKKVSAGERVLLNPKGGGIALFSTTRLVFSYPNRVLNEKFYEIVFEKDISGNTYTLGDIMMYTKNRAGTGINKRNFALLGDPSMKLAYPAQNIVTDSINHKSIAEATDTLNAFSSVTISGHLTDNSGNMLSDFNGIIYPAVFDKKINAQTLANDGGSEVDFTLQNSILYKGKASVKNGNFSFSFIIPKDIDYSYGLGRLSYYASDSVSDAAGYYNEILIGGTSKKSVMDIEGPAVNVYMNSSTFRNGGITDENPVLYVEVLDESGINTTGGGIGHDIVAVLDGDIQSSFLLNEYYQAYLDSYRGGIVSYPLSELEAGLHTVDVKVWDIYNNSTTGSTDFIVMKSDKFFLEDLLNYPNPFSEYTNFSFSHNRPGTDMEITIDILDMDGRLIKTIKAIENNAGFRSHDIYWDGSGAEKNAQTTYIYRIRVKTSEGDSAEKSGKLILIR